MTYAPYSLRNGFERLNRFDASLLAKIHSKRTPWASRLMTLLTRAGDPASWVVHGLVLAALAGPSGRHLPLLLAAGAIAATVLSQLLKRVFRRRRPNDGIPGFVPIVEDPDAFSFPSGHTAVACGVAAALAGADSSLATAEAALAMAIGCSRVYLGAHYPADVVVGAIVGLSSGALVFAGYAALLR